MSNTEFEEWYLIHTKIEPFGERRMDLRAGSIASPIVNALRDLVYKEPEKTKISDWIMTFGKQKVKPLVTQPWQQMQQILKAVAGVFDGRGE